jgi:GNAT superfamily N-acetyltransferase
MTCKKYRIRTFYIHDYKDVIQLIYDIIVNEFKFKFEVDNLDSDLLDIEKNYGKSNGGRFWIAEITNGNKSNDNKIIATTAIRRLKQFESTCELKRMYVLKHYRGLGIGQKMLNKAIDFAKEAGYSRILLDSSKNLKAARRLYLKNGFVDTQRYNNNYRADVFMEKIL